jgi:hypothetical protein
MSNLKNLKINEETHEKLKNYCKENGLKVGKFVENLINSKLAEDSQNELRNLQNNK